LPHRSPSFEVTTIWYRAPEVLWEDPAFGCKVDIWALGLVMAEMTGYVFHQTPAGTMAADIAFRHGRALVKQLGTPEVSSRSPWTSWKTISPAVVRQPWKADVRRLVGSSGELLLDAMLSWDPKQRPSACLAGQHVFLNPLRFGLGGCTASAATFRRGFEPVRRIVPYTGIRHPWNLLTGTIGAETLKWLQQDFDDTGPMDIDFTASRRDVKTEEGRKFIMAGRMANDPACKTMCTLSLAKLLPLPRLRAWFAAFKIVNAESVGALARDARASAAKCGIEGKDENRKHFMESPIDSWFGAAAELCISKAGGSWQEKKHQDGGASVLHMGVTLFGKRRMTCEQVGGEDVWVDNIPGTVYLGGLTGPRHGVRHEPSAEDELLHGSMSVTVMLRTTLFPHVQSRVRGVTPHPQEFFRAISSSFADSFAASPWHLPSLEACHVEFFREASGPSPAGIAGSPAGHGASTAATDFSNPQAQTGAPPTKRHKQAMK
jgi:hypothetical protein